MSGVPSFPAEGRGAGAALPLQPPSVAMRGKGGPHAPPPRGAVHPRLLLPARLRGAPARRLSAGHPPFTRSPGASSWDDGKRGQRDLGARPRRALAPGSPPSGSRALPWLK